MELKMLHCKFVVVLMRVAVMFLLSAKGTMPKFWSVKLGPNCVNKLDSTYAKATQPVDKIVPENTSFLRNKFNPEITDIKKTPWYILDS